MSFYMQINDVEFYTNGRKIFQKRYTTVEEYLKLETNCTNLYNFKNLLTIVTSHSILLYNPQYNVFLNTFYFDYNYYILKTIIFNNHLYIIFNNGMVFTYFTKWNKKWDFNLNSAFSAEFFMNEKFQLIFIGSYGTLKILDMISKTTVDIILHQGRIMDIKVIEDLNDIVIYTCAEDRKIFMSRMNIHDNSFNTITVGIDYRQFFYKLMVIKDNFRIVWALCRDGKLKCFQNGRQVYKDTMTYTNGTVFNDEIVLLTDGNILTKKFSPPSLISPLYRTYIKQYVFLDAKKKKNYLLKIDKYKTDYNISEMMKVYMHFSYHIDGNLIDIYAGNSIAIYMKDDNIYKIVKMPSIIIITDYVITKKHNGIFYKNHFFNLSYRNDLDMIRHVYKKDENIVFESDVSVYFVKDSFKDYNNHDKIYFEYDKISIQTIDHYFRPKEHITGILKVDEIENITYIAYNLIGTLKGFLYFVQNNEVVDEIKIIGKIIKIEHSDYHQADNIFVIGTDVGYVYYVYINAQKMMFINKIFKFKYKLHDFNNGIVSLSNGVVAQYYLSHKVLPRNNILHSSSEFNSYYKVGITVLHTSSTIVHSLLKMEKDIYFVECHKLKKMNIEVRNPITIFEFVTSCNEPLFSCCHFLKSLDGINLLLGTDSGHLIKFDLKTLTFNINYIHYTEIPKNYMLQ